MIGVHVLKNIMIPLVTVIGLEFGSVIAFAIVTETMFAWPGMGKLVIDSIYQLDRPVIVAYLLVVVFMFIVINLVVDLLYSALDPRVRLADMQQYGDERSATRIGSRTATCVDRAQLPWRRFASQFCREQDRDVRPGDAARHRGARALRAVDLAAEPVRPGAARPDGPRLPPGATSLDGMTYWLGTDDQGRDMLSAIFYGLRVSLMVGVVSRRDRADDRLAARRARRLRRRPVRAAGHAHRRHPARLSRRSWSR